MGSNVQHTRGVAGSCRDVRPPTEPALRFLSGSVVPEPDGPGVVDGGQGNSTGSEPYGVDPVPLCQQGAALVLIEGLWAEEQLRVQEPEHVRGGSSAHGRAGGRHDQGGPGAWPVPASQKGAEGCWGVERGYRDVVAPRAACPERGPGQFLACLRCSHSMRHFHEGLVEVPEEPVRVRKLRDIKEPVRENFTTKGGGASHAHNLRFSHRNGMNVGSGRRACIIWNRGLQGTITGHCFAVRASPDVTPAADNQAGYGNARVPDGVSGARAFLGDWLVPFDGPVP